MHRKLTLTVDEAIYEGLHRIVGRGKISQFIEDLVRPYVSDAALDEGYRAMAADTVREAAATEWSNALAADVADEAR
jgi:hypothetical protein